MESLSLAGRPSARGALLAAVALLAAALIGHHLLELAAMLRGDIAGSSLTADFRIYMCGAADLARPYDRCLTAEAVSGFVYPPPSLLYFHLLSALPLAWAFAVHTAVSAASLALAAALVLRNAGAHRTTRIAALLGALAIAPIGTSFAAGQVNVIVMATCVAAACYAAEGRPLRSGLSTALGFWLKLYPGVVPVLFLSRRKFASVIAAIVAVLLLAALSPLWASPRLFLDYFGTLLPHVQKFTQPGAAHSIAGMVLHWQAGGGAPSFHFVPIPKAMQWASKGALAAAIAAALAHRHWTADQRPLDSLGILLCGALIAAPNSWGYHYALIFPALYAALVRGLGKLTWETPLVLFAWLALVVPDWTEPPAFVADWPVLNVVVRGRYALAALLLIGLALRESLAFRRSAN